MAEQDNDFASMADHSVDMDDALASMATGDDPPVESAEVEAVGDPPVEAATDPEVEEEPEPAAQPPTMEAMVQALLPALMPAMGQVMAQAMAPVLERLPQPAAAPPAPNPWELTGDAALTAQAPTSASEYTRGQIARTRQEIARWEPAASDSEHEKHADAKRMIEHHRGRLRDQYHRAELESQLAEMRQKFERLERQPAVQAIAERARNVVTSADALSKNGFAALAEAVKAGDDIADIVADIDWSQPEQKAIADFEAALRLSNRAYERAQARAPKSQPAATKRKAQAVPPKGAAGNRATDDDNDFLSMDEHDALHERALSSRTLTN